MILIKQGAVSLLFLNLCFNLIFMVPNSFAQESSISIGASNFSAHGDNAVTGDSPEVIEKLIPDYIQEQLSQYNFNEESWLQPKFSTSDADFSPTQEQLAEIEKINILYSRYKVIKSKFMQRDSVGGFSKGWFIIQKPGRARVEYDDIPIRFIISGNSLLYQDISLKHKSFLPVNSSPFSYLLEENSSFLNKNLKLLNFVSFDDHNEITLSSIKNPELGRMILFFSKEQGELLKWIILDSKGVATEIYLLEPIFSNQLVQDLAIFNLQRVKEVTFKEVKLR
ncbi:Outer membrane lipoprotein carrier protein LolA [Candidatus Hepatincolaceae symbiont of Richtersius coronifer]